MTKDESISTERALNLALEALEYIRNFETGVTSQTKYGNAAKVIKEALASEAIEQPNGEATIAQQEPVSHSIVAGALFDFMGWLTSRNECLVLSSTDDAAPAADAIKDFAHMRNLSIDDAKVREWQEHLASPPTLSLAQRKPLTDEEYEALVEDLGDWSRYVEVDTAHQALTEHVRQVLAAHGIKGDA